MSILVLHCNYLYLSHSIARQQMAIVIHGNALSAPQSSAVHKLHRPAMTLTNLPLSGGNLFTTPDAPLTACDGTRYWAKIVIFSNKRSFGAR